MRVLKWLADFVKPTVRKNVWGNVIHIIYPYNEGGAWVFDDDRVDLNKEAFVAGADTFIDLGLQELGIMGDDGFRAIFSAVPFPNHQFSLKHKTDGAGGTKGLMGNVYHSPEFGIEGWFCPALYCYFKEPPEAMYIRFEALTPDHIAALKKVRKPAMPFRTHWKKEERPLTQEEFLDELGPSKFDDVSEEDLFWFFGGDVTRE